MTKCKDLFKGEYVDAWEDQDGWLFLNFSSNMTTLSIPDVFKKEVIKDLKEMIKSIGKGER